MLQQQQRTEIRSALLELAPCCPFGHGNPSDCPLYEVRQLNPSQRLEWFDALDDEDLSYLAMYHHICLGIKLNTSGPDK